VYEAKHSTWIAESMAQVAALQQYAMICVVLSGFAFTGLIGFDHATMKKEADWTYAGIHVGSAMVFANTLSIAICTSASLHATLIFALCGIYGSTAVSKADQTGFVRFMKNTGMCRVRAFKAFKISIITMFFNILLVLSSKLPITYALLVCGPTSCGMGVALWHALQVIAAAGDLFRPAIMAIQPKEDPEPEPTPPPPPPEPEETERSADETERSRLLSDED